MGVLSGASRRAFAITVTVTELKSDRRNCTRRRMLTYPARPGALARDPHPRYLMWKLLHIASVIIFLGNITTGLFWAAHAHKSHDLRLIAATFDGIIRSDRRFTIPGVVGIVVSGIGAAVSARLPILRTGWILWPIVLFTVSGLTFGVLAPLQRKILESTRTADSSAAAWGAYEAMYKKWELYGLFAVITPAAAFVIMVLKPLLPAL